MILNSCNTLPVLFLSFSPLLFGTAAIAGRATPQEMNNTGVSPPQLAPVFFQGNLSTYRGFQFGMRLNAAVKHSGMDPSEVLTIHERPAIIQGLDWTPARFSRDPSKSDPVERVQFAFYNGKLSRAVVDYDYEKTKGLHLGDMIKALSVQYGTAVSPAVATSFPSSSFSEGWTVMATWEDSNYSVNLVQSPYGEKFGLIAFSKELNRLAEDSITTGLQMDTQEAPQREKRGKQDAQDELTKVRLQNRSTFRP